MQRRNPGLNRMVVAGLCITLLALAGCGSDTAGANNQAKKSKTKRQRPNVSRMAKQQAALRRHDEGGAPLEGTLKLSEVMEPLDKEGHAKEKIEACNKLARMGARASGSLFVLQKLSESESEDPAVKAAAKEAHTTINDAFQELRRKKGF